MSARAAGWWRRQWPWLLGAVLFAAWAVIGPYLQDRKDYRLMNPSLPRDVASGAWGQYAGARWRLVEVHVVGPMLLKGIALRPDSQAVLATFELVVDKGTNPATVDGCKTKLQDRDERSWDAEPLTLSRFDSKPLGRRSCSSRLGADFQTVYALPGKPFRFQQIYQVPRGVPLAGLRIALNVPLAEGREPRGTFLRFAL